MSIPESARPATRVIHAGQHPEPVTGAVMPPIFCSTTYAQESPGVHKGFEYSRSHNPTRYALERMVAQLEGSTIEASKDPSCGGFAFSSGLAAMATALELVDAGAHVVAMDDIYGGSNRLLRRVRERSQGLKVSFVDMTDLAKLKAALRPDTAMVWVESPTNPTLKIADLAAVCAEVRRTSPGAILVCDNTFASPMIQRPLDFGFDMAMHSSTKYLNGHSDVVGGLLVTGRADLCERLRFLQNAIGSVMGPFDAYLTLRGVKTLALRMERHSSSAQTIAEFLEKDRRVDRVVFPGLASHPQHAIYKKQMRAPGGMITMYLKGGLAEARRFLENVLIFALAESLGGVESLIEHPAIMTHASVPPEMRKTLGISDTMIRLSVGIEDVQDLLEDVKRGLDATG